MSNRTAEASRAVAQAWKMEQILVLSGRGTRDWTPEQQCDILEKGRAYDENGVSWGEEKVVKYSKKGLELFILNL